MLNQFPTVGLLDTTADTSTNGRILFDQAQSGLLHQLFGWGAIVIGDLRKLRFLFGRKMNFHNAKTRLS